MAQGTARRPSDRIEETAAQLSPRADSVPVAAESVAFLEAAGAHLRDAGYHVELDYDQEAGEALLFVDGIEVRFVRSLPGEPLKH